VKRFAAENVSNTSVPIPSRELAADDARVQALAGASAEEWTHG
jgi:hypothetical protein